MSPPVIFEGWLERQSNMVFWKSWDKRYCMVYKCTKECTSDSPIKTYYEMRWFKDNHETPIGIIGHKERGAITLVSERVNFSVYNSKSKKNYGKCFELGIPNTEFSYIFRAPTVVQFERWISVIEAAINVTTEDLEKTDNTLYESSEYLLRLLEAKRAQYDVLFDDYTKYYERLKTGNDSLPARYMPVSVGVPKFVSDALHQEYNGIRKEENDEIKMRRYLHHNHHHHYSTNNENEIPDSTQPKSIFVEKGYISEEEREGLKRFFIDQKEKHIQSSSRDYSYKIMQLRRLSLFHHCNFLDESEYEDLRNEVFVDYENDKLKHALQENDVRMMNYLQVKDNSEKPHVKRYLKIASKISKMQKLSSSTP